MGQYIHNRGINCMYCNYGPFMGKEGTYQTRFGIVKECRWTCPQCGSLARHDESEPIKPKPEDPRNV